MKRLVRSHSDYISIFNETKQKLIRNIFQNLNSSGKCELNVLSHYEYIPTIEKENVFKRCNMLNNIQSSYNAQ